MRVGFVGLGYMGAPMAGRLLEMGHQVYVFDIDASRSDEVATNGATAVSSPAELAKDVEVVVSSLSDLDAIRSTLLGDNGLLGTLAPGSVYVELSTSSWEMTKELAARCAEQGIGYLDCPVSAAGGGPASGTMTLMVGGDPEVLERARPVLEDLGRIFYAGPTGCGMAAKLATQYIGYTSVMASLEALVFARKAGVDLDVLYEIIPASAARGRIPDGTLEDLKNRDWGDPVTRRPGAPVYIIEKDMHLALEIAEAVGAEARAGQPGYEVLHEALERGLGEFSYIRAIELLEERAGLA